MNHSELSVQLYTVREALHDDLTGTLARIAEIGYRRVEPFDLVETIGLADALASAGLAAPTAHQDIIGLPETELHEIFGLADAMGIARVMDPWVTPERWQSTESIAAIAAELNEAARIAHDHGVAVGYHNHVHELESVIDGRLALDIFADMLDPTVGLELDTYWVVVAGQDPVDVLDRLGERVVAIHVKDGPGTAEIKDQVAVGSGSLSIREILAAAPNALRVVELDDSRGDRFQAIADSYAYLATGNFA